MTETLEGTEILSGPFKDAVVSPPAYTSKRIEVYVCPTPDCPDFYGAAGQNDLHERFTGPKAEDRAALRESTGSSNRHSRAQCPTCRQRGIQVERVLVGATVLVPTEGPAPQPLPLH
jgi:hypothetical protein